jgi:hypothetical protein
MIMSGFSQIEMSGFKAATIFFKKQEGGYCGQEGHYQDEYKGSSEAADN